MDLLGGPLWWAALVLPVVGGAVLVGSFEAASLW